MMVRVDRVRTPPSVSLVLDGTRSQRPARLASIVLEELAHQIIGGTLPQGSVLPTEPTLGEQFGFSRTVIREGLKQLDSWNLLDPAVIRIALEYDHYDRDMSLLDDLITVRRVLEEEMARVAAARLTEEELATLAENIERMEETYDDYDRFRALDNAFHAVVMRASGNQVGLTIVRTIHTHGGVRPPLAAAASRAALKRTVVAHRAIYDALAARDGETAGELISKHINSAWAERKRTKRFT